MLEDEDDNSFLELKAVESTKPKGAQCSIGDLYQYTTKREKILMTVGVIGAVLGGAG